MKRIIIVLFVMLALSANANAETNSDPYNDFISLEIERLELEQNLFGNQTINEAVSIASVSVYEVEEDVVFKFDTKSHLPESFNAKDGMGDINWDTVELYELEEELGLGFYTKDYLPKNFNPYRGMNCDAMLQISNFQ